jgi:hypothetical protein
LNPFTKSAYSVAGIGLFSAVAASAQPGAANPEQSAVVPPAVQPEAPREQKADDSATASTPKDAEQEKAQKVADCMVHHEGAQEARLRGAFLEAQAELRACAEEDCPEALRTDCLEWRAQVEAVLPTVIVVAEGDAGDLSEARVVVDGEVLRESLDGRPIALDPGTHVVSVTLPDGQSKEQRVVLSEGERGRRLQFDFKAPPVMTAPLGAPPTRTIRPVPPGVYILGATAFIGLGVGVGFGSDAWSKSRTARDLCAPLCDPDVSRAVSERAAVADVALGVFVASTVGAIVLYSYRPERIIPVERVALGMDPHRGGTISVEGTF